MDLNKLTIKARAALEGAHQQALARNNQQVEPEHLLFALLSDPEGVVYPLLHQLGVQPRTLRDRVEESLERIPKVYAQGAEVRFSPATQRLLAAAGSEAEQLTDEYLSTEHLLLGMLEGEGAAASALRSAGLTRDGALAALAEIRGRRRVTSENPEEDRKSVV